MIFSSLRFPNLPTAFSGYSTIGVENNSLCDKICGFLLAAAPLLQHYKGIYVNAGILVLVLCLPWIGIRLLLRFRELEWKRLIPVLPLILFLIYRVADHGTTFMEIAHCGVLCAYFAAIALGGINLRYVFTSAYLIAMASVFCIVIQSICYYLFGFHLQLVATDFLLEESSQWVALAQTGVVGVNGKISAFYRPSGFFLEPSHMFLYLTPNLMMLLLSRQMNLFKRLSAAALSLGLILSTSGMGIAVVAGTWLLQLGFGRGKENLLRFRHLFCKQNILRCILFVVVFVVLAVSLPSIRYSVMRIFMGNQAVNAIIASEQAEKAAGSEQYAELMEKAQDAAEQMQVNAGSTAVSGRTERALSLIRNRMKGMQYLIGVGDTVGDVTFNLPGFFATMYKYGLIGVVLSYLFYLSCAVFAKGAYRWMAIIIIGISFFSAHTHGTFYMLFYVLMLIDGLMERSSKAM